MYGVRDFTKPSTKEQRKLSDCLQKMAVSSDMCKHCQVKISDHSPDIPLLKDDLECRRCFILIFFSFQSSFSGLVFEVLQLSG
jgi:hypothetical protein